MPPLACPCLGVALHVHNASHQRVVVSPAHLPAPTTRPRHAYQDGTPTRMPQRARRAQEWLGDMQRRELGSRFQIQRSFFPLTISHSSTV